MNNKLKDLADSINLQLQGNTLAIATFQDDFWGKRIVIEEPGDLSGMKIVITKFLHSYHLKYSPYTNFTPVELEVVETTNGADMDEIRIFIDTHTNKIPKEESVIETPEVEIIEEQPEEVVLDETPEKGAISDEPIEEENSENGEVYKKGGPIPNLSYPKIYEVLKDKIEEVADDTPYENDYDHTGHEIEYKPASGFIPFTDGGYEVTWFEYVNSLSGSGKRLPTKPLQVELERQVEKNYKYARESFIEKHPDIVEELGEDNIDYNSLQEAGYC